jgi:hypothetical protein
MYSGTALSLAAMYLADADVCLKRSLRQKSRCRPPVALPGASEWRHSGGDGAHCPCALPLCGPPRGQQNHFQDEQQSTKVDCSQKSTTQACRQAGKTQKISFGLGENSAESPLGATFIVNSEPLTGAHPSVHLCGGAN